MGRYNEPYLKRLSAIENTCDFRIKIQAVANWYFYFFSQKMIELINVLNVCVT